MILTGTPIMTFRWAEVAVVVYSNLLEVRAPPSGISYFQGKTIDSFYVFYCIVSQKFWVICGSIFGNMMEGGVWGQWYKRKFCMKASCSSCLVLEFVYNVELLVRVKAGKCGYFNFWLHSVPSSRPLAELIVLGKIRRWWSIGLWPVRQWRSVSRRWQKRRWCWRI